MYIFGDIIILISKKDASTCKLCRFDENAKFFKKVTWKCLEKNLKAGS